jgi:hypothetical protein
VEDEAERDAEKVQQMAGQRMEQAQDRVDEGKERAAEMSELANRFFPQLLSTVSFGTSYFNKGTSRTVTIFRNMGPSPKDAGPRTSAQIRNRSGAKKCIAEKNDYVRGSGARMRASEGAGHMAPKIECSVLWTKRVIGG